MFPENVTESGMVDPKVLLALIQIKWLGVFWVVELQLMRVCGGR